MSFIKRFMGMSIPAATEEEPIDLTLDDEPVNTANLTSSPLTAANTNAGSNSANQSQPKSLTVSASPAHSWIGANFTDEDNGRGFVEGVYSS